MTNDKHAHMSLLVPAIGLALTLAWYYCCSNWLNGSRLSALPLTVHITRISAMVIVGIVVYLLSFSSKALKRRKALFIVAILMCEIAGMTLLFTEDFGQFDGRMCIGFLQGACLPLLLMLWSRCRQQSSPKEAGLMLAIAFLLAGGLMAILSMLHVDIPFAPVTLPLAFGACYLYSLHLDGPSAPLSVLDARSASPFHDRSFMLLVFCAALIGFVTGQYYCLSVPTASYSTYFGMFMLAGIALLFVFAFSAKPSDYALVLMLFGAFVFVIVSTAIFLPEMDSAFAIIIGTMHWSCLLLYAIAFRDPTLPPRANSARAFVALSSFLIAGSFGGLAAVILPELMAIGLLAGITLAVVSYLLTRNSERPFIELVGGEQHSEETGARETTLSDLAKFYRLTEREFEVFRLLAEGNTLKSIAARLYLSENIVKSHRKRIYQKLGIASRQELLDMVRGA